MWRNVLSRWMAGLHGGQLVMLLVGLALAGLPAVGVAVIYSNYATASYGMAERADHQYFATGDTAQMHTAAWARHAADAGYATSLKWVAVSLAIWATAIPILWIWFGARRRSMISVEIVEEISS